MSSNPRIGKVLRIPIELVPEDERKIDEAIRKIGTLDSNKKENAAVDESINDAVNQSIEEITGHDIAELGESLKITEQIKTSGVNDMISLSKDSIANLIGIAKNPTGAILGIFLKKFAKGAGAIALALIIMEAIRYAIDYLMRDGMPLDRRFKRYTQKEVLSFLDRLTKMQLRQGYRSVTVTTLGRLRGGQGQVGGNMYSILQGTISQKLPSSFYTSPIGSGSTKGSPNRFGVGANR